MPSKTTKRARNAAKTAPLEKDDGSRWIVVRHGKPIYPYDQGQPKREALRLAEGLLEAAEILQIS